MSNKEIKFKNLEELISLFDESLTDISVKEYDRLKSNLNNVLMNKGFIEQPTDEKYSDLEGIELFKSNSTIEKKLRLRASKIYDNISLMNDMFFQEVASSSNVLPQEIINAVLGSGYKVIECRTQVRLTNSGSKNIVLDCVTINENGDTVNIEIQNATKDFSDKRTRFYLSSLDLRFLSPGDKYEKLPPTTIIVLYSHDPKKQNLPLYRFKRSCVDETGNIIRGKDGEEITFNDEQEIFYINCAYKGDYHNEELVDLIHDMKCTDSLFYNNNISKAVTEYKNKFKERMVSMSVETILRRLDMTNEELMEEGIEKGIEIGEKKGIEIGEKKGIEIGETNFIEKVKSYVSMDYSYEEAFLMAERDRNKDSTTKNNDFFMKDMEDF